ncbi:MAG TPA: sigma-70 family RNA polymerase sigma factor [Opitutaceae bacterium]|jgi:RNA polymerase sigma factor (sigma-70 family)|nr:sigma-70 family RNA polymerase sigma factor [Opitutaceae bacterium]
MPDDAELLQRYVRGSDAAFTELVQRHANLVYSVALRQTGGDAHLAADVTSAVFTDLARRARGLAGGVVLGGWLYRAARFEAADAVRAERRRRERERKAHLMEELAAEGAPPASAVDWEKLRPVLDHAISELPARDRDAVVLRFFEDRSFADLGARLRVSENAARKRVAHALERMQRALRRRGVRSTEAALAVILAQQVATAAPSALVASIVPPWAGAAPAGLLVSTFMKATQTWKIAAGLALLLAGTATFVHQQRTIGRLESENAGLRLSQQQVARLRAEIGRLHAAARAGSRGGALDGAAGAGRAGAFGPMNIVRSLNSPDMQRLMALQQKFALDSRYAGLFKQLHLGADKLDQLKQLMVSRQMVANDVFGSAVQQGLDPMQDRSELAGLVKDGEAKVDDEIRSLLGDEDFAAYQSYEQTLPQRSLVQQLQQSLSYSAEPLTDAQADQLVQILAQNPAPAPAGGGGARVAVSASAGSGPGEGLPPPTFMFGGPPISDAAVAAASSLLTPAQLAALQSLQQQQAAMGSILQTLKSVSGQAGVPFVQIRSSPD